jgi:soluble epoxide hydrolase / lipid-phosphate phosphatase
MTAAEETWTHATVETNGIRMHYVEQGSGFPVLLLHGFPELWYSWRHQIPALAGAGFRAIAPDLRGYGGSDKPYPVEDYDIQHLTDDLVGLLDALGIEKTVIVGHDWGGIIVWQFALMHPERVERVIALNTPFLPRAPISPIEAFKAAPDGRFNYILHFQEEGVAEREMEADIEGTLRTVMRSTAGNASAITDEDIAVFADAFRAGGLRGPINFYRNFHKNWETTEYLAGRQVTVPSLMITAEKDPVLKPEMADGMGRWVPNVRFHHVKDSGHWTQQEQPDEVNRVMIDFLADLRG